MTTSLDPIAFAYHELRAPLGLLATAAQFAADECEQEGDDDRSRRWETVVRTAERILRTADQVLHLNSLAATEESSPYSPTDILLALVEDVRALNVPVTCEVTPAARRAWATGVPARFEALLQSLLNNAIDHGEQGEEIRISAHETDGSLRIEVTNTIARVRRHKGLGLGTVVSNTLATQLGADLELSAEGDRYRAVARLPLR